ncbi:type II secretion system protein GspM [Methylopila sp. M107]|uniref:type II secretion system protein GspM n=1 Tax=Methylopila sp. M107 TaxID=1101190 RepID=UPI00036984B3|nr:type II secretion system protein GspM [Methylopila sp. M107]
MITAEAFTKHRRPIALGLLGVALFAGTMTVVVPVTASIVDAREEIASDRERLATLRAKRADLSALEAALKEIRARQAGRPLVVEAPTTTAAFEKLEAMIRDLASQHEAAIGSTRMLRLEDDSGLKAMRVEVEISIHRSRLTPLIAAIETAAPMMFIEKIRIAASDGSEAEGRAKLTAALRMFAVIAPAVARK